MGSGLKYVLSSAALLAGLAFTSAAYSETLQEALVAAYTSNPTLLAERARLRATDETANQARAGWRPTVSLNGQYSMGESQRQVARFFGGSFPFTDETYTEQYSATLNATQPLFRGFQTLNASKAADARIRAGQAQLWSTEQQVLLETVTAYSDVIRDQAVVDLNRNNVQVLKRQLQASRDRFRVGEITRTDVAQSEARLSRSQSDLTRSEAALSESRARFGVVVGRAPGTLESKSGLPNLPQSLDQAINMAVSNNPGLRAAQENEMAAGFDVSQAKGGLLPTVDLQGQLNSTEATNRRDSQSTNTSFVTSLNIPLYQGGAAYSRVRQAKHLHSQTRLQVAETRRQVVQAATNSWQNLVAARAAIESDKQQVRANEIAYEGVRQEAQVGSRTTLDVLDAEQELLDSRVALVRTQRDVFVAAYQLLSSVGGLTAENLKLPVELYDPVENYQAVKNKLIGWGANDYQTQEIRDDESEE